MSCASRRLPLRSPSGYADPKRTPEITRIVAVAVAVALALDGKEEAGSSAWAAAGSDAAEAMKRAIDTSMMHVLA